MVECDALEMRFGGDVNGGSNPPLSVSLEKYYSVGFPCPIQVYQPLVKSPLSLGADVLVF